MQKKQNKPPLLCSVNLALNTAYSSCTKVKGSVAAPYTCDIQASRCHLTPT